MAEEIILLDWTNDSGRKKGELVIQKDGLFLYKTSKIVLHNVKNFRDVVYAEIPFDAIEEVHLARTGVTRSKYVRIKLKREVFQKIIKEKHSALVRHLYRLFNRKNHLYLGVLNESLEDAKKFVNILKEHMQK